MNSNSWKSGAARLGLTLGLILALAGCDNTPAETDAGPGATDSGPPAAAPLLGVPMEDGDGNLIDDLTMLEPIDLSCRGSRTAPAAGAAASYDLVATDFFSGSTVEGLTVNFYPDNVPTADCTGTCVSGTTNADGVFNVTATADSWYAYSVAAGSGTHEEAPADYVAATQINEPGPADGGEAALNVVRQTTVDLITGILLINQDPANAILTGQVQDCAGRNITNARVRVFNSDGEVTLAATGRTEPREFYFGGTASPTPMRGETDTFVNGLYGAGNIPVTGDGQARVEIWGTVTEGGAPEMIGCERVDLNAGGITILNINPTRADGPSDCSG